MRRITVIFFSICVSGCSSMHQQGGIDSSRTAPLAEGRFLTSEQARATHLQEFLNSHEIYSEQEKINYLLNLMRVSDVVFVRNGDHYTGLLAARWLRWKMMHRQFHDNPIVTARDFVERVCPASKRSGLPYEVILSDKSRHRLQPVIFNELLTLENAIRQESLVTAVSENEAIRTAGKNIPIPIMLPASR